jgi:Bacterial signalling protein N terminal repeat
MLSVLIAIFTSYAALVLAGRVTAAAGWVQPAWLAGAAASGFGIWSMHSIGMLAYKMPIAVAYDWPIVLLSLLAAIFASGIPLYLVSRKDMSGEAAQSAVRTNADWRRRYVHLAMRGQKSIAKVAMARKLGVRLYWMWRNGWDYSQLVEFGSHAGKLGIGHGVKCSVA